MYKIEFYYFLYCQTHYVGENIKKIHFIFQLVENVIGIKIQDLRKVHIKEKELERVPNWIIKVNIKS